MVDAFRYFSKSKTTFFRARNSSISRCLRRFHKEGFFQIENLIEKASDGSRQTLKFILSSLVKCSRWFGLVKQFSGFQQAGLDVPTNTLGAPSSCGLALSENRLLTYDSSPDLFPSREDVRPAFESRKPSPRSFYILLRYESYVKTSTIPRFFPSRLSCQCLIAASSPSNVAKRLTQNMLAPS